MSSFFGHCGYRAAAESFRRTRYRNRTPLAWRLGSCVADLSNRACPVPPAQIVKATALAYLEVDRAGYSGGEPGDGARGTIEPPYPPAAEVSKEVVADITAREPPGGRVVEGAAGYGTSRGVRAAMPVGEDGIAVLRIRLGALVSGPPVVRSRSAPIDLLPSILPHVVDEHLAGVGLNRKAEGVAKPERPNGTVTPRSPLVEGVALWDRAVLVDAQHLPLQGAQGLRVVAVGVVAHGHVEHSVLTEVYGSSVVVRGSAQVVQPEDELLAARDGPIAVRGDADHPVMGRGGGRLPRVVEIDVVVAGETGIEGDPQQPAFARRVYLSGDIQERRQLPARLYHSQRTALFGHEQPTVGRELHGRRARKAADDPRLREVGRERGGASRVARGEYQNGYDRGQQR